LAQIASEEQLRVLCLQLGVHWADLEGVRKQHKTITLLNELDEQNRVLELVELLYGLLTALRADQVPSQYLEELRKYQAMNPQELKASFIPLDQARFDVEYTYTVYGNGDVQVETHVVPGADLPPLPRIGLQMALPGAYTDFTWYGRGPHESYADRKLGAPLSIYRGTVAEQYVPYITPQENGNKSDVRWAALCSDLGTGLLVVGDVPQGGVPWLNVSVHHFNTHDLAAANHTYELKHREEVTLNLDYAQGGLGNGSAGPGVLPKYLLEPSEVRFRLGLRPFLTATSLPVELSKRGFGRF
jgi:hypothetical protein